MTNPTLPLPEPLEGVDLPVVAWQHSENGGSFVSDYAKTMNSAQEWPMYYSIALTPHADAQATINALRAERDSLREHLARSEALLAIALKQNENADRRALKAVQPVAVDRAMELAGVMEMRYADMAYAEEGDDDAHFQEAVRRYDAAREALRAELAKSATPSLPGEQL